MMINFTDGTQFSAKLNLSNTPRGDLVGVFKENKNCPNAIAKQSNLGEVQNDY